MMVEYRLQEALATQMLRLGLSCAHFNPCKFIKPKVVEILSDFALVYSLFWD